MANGTQAPGGQRKGLHPLAWVGIGCGGLLVVVALVAIVAMVFLVGKAKDVAEEFEANPGLAAARTIVKFNPELEEVEADEDAGTITVRNTRTGQVVTVDYDEIKEGRLSFSSDEGELTIDASGGEGGQISVTGEDGEQTFNLQTGERWQGEVPEWVPEYPGAERGGGYEMAQGDGMRAGFQLETDASAQEIMDFYRSKLEQAGFDVSVSTFSSDGSEGGMVQGGHADSGRTLQVVVGQEDGKTTAALNYTFRKP